MTKEIPSSFNSVVTPVNNYHKGSLKPINLIKNLTLNQYNKVINDNRTFNKKIIYNTKIEVKEVGYSGFIVLNLLKFIFNFFLYIFKIITQVIKHFLIALSKAPKLIRYMLKN